MQHTHPKNDVAAHRTELSERMAKDMKKRGFRFVGPTTVYSFMQAVGMVNDHLTSCPFHTVCFKLGQDF